MENKVLTNRDISENFRDIELHLSPKNFLSAFAYWATYQNPFGCNGVEKATNAYEIYLSDIFSGADVVFNIKKFNWEEIERVTSSAVFESIPEIYELNQTEGGFIDLGALSRNIFYMVLRLEITQPL